MPVQSSKMNYVTDPSDRRINITSEAALSLSELRSYLDQFDKKKLSPILRNVDSDLKAQYEDESLRETTIGGRDARTSQFVMTGDELTQMSRIPQEQWLRYLEYRYKFKIYPRQQILPDFPMVVGIEPTSICNLKCQMCFQSDDSFAKNKDNLGYMDFDLYKLIVDEMQANKCEAVIFASRGEPTLHPRFADMLSYVTPRVLDVKINTNGTRLTEKLCHGILEANPSLVVFSIDSAEPAQYEDIRKGAKFEKVARNVERFRDIREKQYPASRTLTRVSATIFRDDQDVTLLQNFWSEYVDQVASHTAWPLWDAYNAKLSEVKKPCGLLWERIHIWYDGTCNWCDNDYKSHLAVGKIDGKLGIRDIWNGELAQKHRKLHGSGNKNSLIPCNRCSGTA